MGYTAVHAGWGRLDASLDDLGCGRSWADVHRVKGLELACPECRGRVFARISPHRARHFYHQVRPRDCELANESPEHHLLKLELATAARAAGFRAELEVGNEARTWRADVLVFDRQDRPFIALEAQLSPMTPQDARMRTDRYAADGVAVCWVAMEKRPWERGVPSLRVAPPRDRGDAWTVRHGMARYTWAAPRTVKTKAAWTHISCCLDEAVRWILQGRVHAHTGPGGSVWWTAHSYVHLAIARARLEADAEAVQQAAAAEQRRRAAQEQAAATERVRLAAEQRRLAAEEEAHEEQQAEQERLADFFEHAGIKAALWPAFMQLVCSASGKAVTCGDQSPAHGNGLLLYSRPRKGAAFQLAGVVCPDPSALAGWPADLTILVPGRVWLLRIEEAAQSLLKVAVLDPVTQHCAYERVGPRTATLT
ncbi:competence protein CoiA [Streptomyces sp. AM8-1-1]|uniref:competence protein CoiA n=1 Tax=Streptomyces sp. AM8-1-1 TaxID=3075825 RepID=UPI0028C3E86D|nr:competence protein CoiA family protein [Streptomyces sp. AM8-1-1]WNO70132.1 competence protein CoiA family protein [Streptomyces sp. AM8-1-1]WNO76983.1 competence protein CoiA family protein [Streptomyces sp. AM8-1-1]